MFSFEKFENKTVSNYLELFTMSTAETDEGFEVERSGELKLPMSGFEMVDDVEKLCPVKLLPAD